MEKAPYLDMPEGLHGIEYKQQFVKAKTPVYPCNYAAEKSPTLAEAMATMTKHK